MNMTFARVRPTVAPTKGTPGSAGLDIYIPNFTKEYIKDYGEQNYRKLDYNGIQATRIDTFDHEIILSPKTAIVIPIGLKFNIPKGYGLFAFNKSGVVIKQTVIKLAEVIDHDYQGEVFVSIWNYGEEFIRIKENQKIIQLVLLEVPEYTLQEVEELDLYTSNSIRGNGAMGSTGL
jgi:dUTP pyrophosphatase